MSAERCDHDRWRIAVFGKVVHQRLEDHALLISYIPSWHLVKQCTVKFRSNSVWASEISAYSRGYIALNSNAKKIGDMIDG